MRRKATIATRLDLRFVWLHERLCCLKELKADMRKYSVFAVAREAMRSHKGWDPQWISPEPRSSYDVIIIGGGGHGLGAAYYLAKEHGITNVAVIEKGWLGGGNTGRNTTTYAPTISMKRAWTSTSIP